MADLKDRLRSFQGASTQSLKDRLSSAQAKVDEGETMQRGEAARVSFFDNAVDFGFNLPAGLSELAAQGLAATSAGLAAPGRVRQKKMAGEDASVIDEFKASRESALQTAPLQALQNFPRPPENLGEQFRAIGSAADPRDIGTPDRPAFGDRLSQARETEATRTAQAEELFPGTFSAVQTGVDVGAMLLGRKPLARARAPGQAAKRAEVIEQARKGFDDLPHNVKGKFEDVFTEKVLPFFKESGERLGRAGVKAGETGFEAALFAAVHDGDLSSSFGLAAGAQSAGSAALFLSEKPVARLLPAVGVAFVVSEMMKAVGPGDQDFFESKDFAIQKTVAALTLGLASGMMGLGRLRGPTAERFPALMDSITAAPRSVLTSRIAEISKASEEGNEAPMQVLQRFSVNASAFSTDQQNALMRALMSEKEGAFAKEVNRLMGNADFVKRLAPRDLNDPAQRLRAFTPTQPIQRN